MSEGILSRWARRKQEVRLRERVPASPAPGRPDAPPVESQPEGEANLAADPALEDEGLADAIARLPKIEDLTAETELAPFLRAGIPAALRKAALRRMWSVDPAIRDFVSEARDYAYDWNTPGGVPGMGPMLPTDDIKAMVERIMTGHAPRPSEAPSPDDPREAEEPTVEPPAAEVMEAEPQVVVAQETAVVHVEEATLHPPENAVRTFQSPAIVSPLRRHGGALPS
jgi:hypothetical protein